MKDVIREPTRPPFPGNARKSDDFPLKCNVTTCCLVVTIYGTDRYAAVLTPHKALKSRRSTGDGKPRAVPPPLVVTTKPWTWHRHHRVIIHLIRALWVGNVCLELGYRWIADDGHKLLTAGRQVGCCRMHEREDSTHSKIHTTLACLHSRNTDPKRWAKSLEASGGAESQAAAAVKGTELLAKRTRYT